MRGAIIYLENSVEGVEIFKVQTSTSKATPSMRHALKDLKLKRLDVIHAGEASFSMAERIRAISLSRLLSDLAPLEQEYTATILVA